MGICNGAKRSQKSHDSDFSKVKTSSRTKDFDRNESHLKTTSVLPTLAIDNNVVVSECERNPLEIYSKEKVVGEGSFGVVWLVKHIQIGCLRAMKVISKRKSKKGEDADLIDEISILRKLDHPNILKILEFYSTPEAYYIITEYCQLGELYTEIYNNAPFPESPTSFIMYQIFQAINYCHGMNIIHRDLKPENILIEKRERNGSHRIKIIDFGTAKIFEKGLIERKIIGSSYYIAPEVLSKNYSEKCDLWSCGVIMYILLTGRPPFGGENDKEIMRRIKRGKYDLTSYPWNIYSKEAKDLVSSLLIQDPNKRLSAEQALKHPWFELKNLKTKDRLNEMRTDSTKKLISNLKKYRSANILQCAVIAYLVHNNTQLDQVHEAIKLFNRMDKNGNGKIDKEELYSGLQSYLKVSSEALREEVDIIFANIDTDQNGYIEYEEFIRAAISKDEFLTQEFLKFAFNYFDRDLSGVITPDELKKVFFQNEKNKNDPDAERQLDLIFEQIDSNGDGSISFEEFCIMMKNIIED